jgi:hypothetical protein
MRNGSVCIRRSILGGLVIALAALAGCGKSGMPKLPAVKGKVMLKDGDVAKLVGGFVRFQSLTDPGVTAVGVIEDGGEFTMGTVVDQKPVGGVREGEYVARVDPPTGEAEEGVESERRAARLVHPSYSSFKTSGLKYTVGPGENYYTIEIAKRR